MTFNSNVTKTQVCTRCTIEKSWEAFHPYNYKPKTLRPERRASWCKACLEGHTRELEFTRRWSLDVFKDEPCADCGVEQDIACMQFHHRIPEDKLFTIGAHVTRKWSALRDEISKCDIICANCHKMRHAYV